MKVYKHLFFDLDHTIWDFEKNATESLLDLYDQMQLNKLGLEDKDVYLKNYLQHNEYWWEQYHKGKVSSLDLRWKRMYSTLLDYNIDNKELAVDMSNRFLDILPEKQGVFDYCYELLDYLQAKNYQLHLITNGFTITQQRKLKASNLTSYFTHVVTSEATGFVKPNKEIFDYALHISNASLDNSIMLGDNIEADIIGANNAGLDTVFVNHISAQRPAEATYEVTHLKELVALF